MEERFRFHGKDVIFNARNSHWAIIIMPDKLLIDNFHGDVHFHIDKKTKIKITILNSDKIFFKVMKHIESEKGLDKYKLLEELR